MSGWTIYEVLAPVFLGLLGWLATRLAALIREHIKNAQVAEVLIRFSDAVLTAVKFVNQTAKQEILRAKSETSPGGATITAAEADRLKGFVWHQLKLEYGGMEGIKKLLSILGVKEGKEEEWVNSRIEAAVHDVKMTERAVADPTRPATHSSGG